MLSLSLILDIRLHFFILIENVQGDECGDQIKVKIRLLLNRLIRQYYKFHGWPSQCDLCILLIMLSIWQLRYLKHLIADEEFYYDASRKILWSFWTCHICMEDTGIGIPLCAQYQVFILLMQADSSTLDWQHIVVLVLQD